MNRNKLLSQRQRRRPERVWWMNLRIQSRILFTGHIIVEFSSLKFKFCIYIKPRRRDITYTIRRRIISGCWELFLNKILRDNKARRRTTISPYRRNSLKVHSGRWASRTCRTSHSSAFLELPSPFSIRNISNKAPRFGRGRWGNRPIVSGRRNHRR